MKVLTGHLTQTEKKAIKAILIQAIQQGPFTKVSARVGKKDYSISLSLGNYKVVVYQMDRGLIPVPGSPLRLSSFTSTFTA